MAQYPNSLVTKTLSWTLISWILHLNTKMKHSLVEDGWILIRWTPSVLLLLLVISLIQHILQGFSKI